MPTDEYPQTVLEVIDDNMTYRPAALHAVRAFARSKPWRGEMEARKEKYRQLNHDLSEAYGIPEPTLVFGQLDGGSSGNSYYHRTRHQIVLNGRLSVVTMLHEWAHARGMNERNACRWSVNLFKRCFPRSFSRLVQVGHMLVRPEDLRR
jgi:hypothetical protein